MEERKNEAVVSVACMSVFLKRCDADRCANDNDSQLLGKQFLKNISKMCVPRCDRSTQSGEAPPRRWCAQQTAAHRGLLRPSPFGVVSLLASDGGDKDLDR
jgi:hypothetical protein